MSVIAHPSAARALPSALLAATALIVTLSGTAARAQPVSEPRNFSAERFRLSLDRDGLLSAEWAEVPAHLSYDVSFWLGYADDPLVLYRNVGDERERLGALVAKRLGAGVVMALGLFDWVQVGVELPLVLYQDRQDSLPGVLGPLEGINGVGLGSIRVAPKLRILQDEAHGVGLAFMPAFVLPTGQQRTYAGQDSLQFEPELLVSKSMGLWRGAANLGVRLRKPEVAADLEVDDEIFLRLAGGLSFAKVGAPPLELEAVLSVATKLDAPFADRSQNHVETLLGATYDFRGPLLAFVAAGLGLNRGHGTPDWRVLGGLRVSEHVRDRDKDGLTDDVDGCPELPEDLDGFDDSDGCPEADNDGDGIIDGQDPAPLGPEDMDGFEDGDGQPDPDNDGDGVWDWDDACPEQPGPAVNLGCPERDSDSDGILDREDRCPQRAEDKDGFEDTDGCPESDDDGDGLLDAEDRCPRAPGPAAGGGCPDADRDGDGVVDRLDNCPDVAGDPATQGCKDKQRVAIVGDQIQVLDKVYFKSARAKIQARSNALLDNVAKVLLEHPELARIEVQGHTDDRGRASSNLRLSQRRAEAVVAYLVRKGVAPTRLTAKGYGQTRPVADNGTREGRADNRRVELTILERR